ncbi:acyl-CoA dehydrogenase family protein [Streptomyces sp. NPDC001939]
MSRFADELRSLVDDLAASGRPDLWGSLCDLGLPRVGIDEGSGGSGGSLDDLLVVVEALAGHGIGVPVVEASTADWVLGHARELDGELTTVVLLDRAPRTASGAVTAELTAVPWARDAARLVLCAPGCAPLLVDLRHASVTVRDVDNIAGEPRDTVILAGTPTVTLDGAPSHEAVRERLALLWSAAVLGAARSAYKLTKTYVSEREQFGAPLLKIPAVSGNLARMRVQLVQADGHARRHGPLRSAPGQG